jgi:hypothetical protein
MFERIFRLVEFITDFIKVLVLSVIATCLVFSAELVKMLYGVSLVWYFSKDEEADTPQGLLFEMINDYNRKYEGLDDIVKGAKVEGAGTEKH